jgi:DNA polymerase
MVITYAINNGPVQVVDVTAESAEGVKAIKRRLLERINEAVRVIAHNSAFDRTVLSHWLGEYLPPDKWLDSMVRATMHSLQGGLDPLSEQFKLGETDEAKMKDGRQLVQLFCKPRPKTSKTSRATSDTHPEQWARFLEYAAQDITAMRALYPLLPCWNFTPDEIALWRLDQRINDRGFMVDVALADAAISAVADAKEGLDERTQSITDGDVQTANQRDMMLKHLVEAYGVTLPDLTASTLERRVGDMSLPEGVRELLAIRLQTAKGSTAKYRSLINGVSADGRMRGTLQFCGAGRTGRWSGRLFQPQNMPRPDMQPDDIAQGIVALKEGCAEVIYPDVMRLTANAIRGCIIAPPGKKLYVADLSNIEGRMLAWLAGETWKVQAFAAFDNGEGHDLYALAYARAFGITPEAVMEDKKKGLGLMRQIGKVMELGLGYEGGVGAFLQFAAVYRMDLADLTEAGLKAIPNRVLAESRNTLAWVKEKKRPRYGLSDDTYVVCDAIKRLWREAHPNTVTFWRALNDAARDAIALKIRTKVGPLEVSCVKQWLRVKLPSGRYLCYPGAKIDAEGRISYLGVNQYTRKWERLNTYGGKLVENVTQAASRDVLAHSMQPIEDAGYSIVLTVHDEIIAEADDSPGFSHTEMANLMAANPPWAAGLPLAAAGFEAYRYRKE